MSDANRLKVAIGKESSWGTIFSGALKDLPYSSESLARNAAYATSRLIRADRQVVDSILTDVSAQGDLNYELLYKGTASPAIVAYDELIEAALFSAAWTSPVTNTGTYASDSGTSKITGTGCGAGIAVGDWIRWDSAVANATPTYHVVTVHTSDDDITVLPAPTTRASTAASEVEAGAYVKNGITVTSFTVEKEYGGVAATFAHFVGMMVDRWSMMIGTGGPISGAFGFFGKNEAHAAATINVGTELTPSTNRVFSAVSHVYALMTGTSLASLQISEWGFDLRNNLRPLTAVANLGAIAIGTGSVDVTGRLVRYFDSMSEMTQFLADTETQHAAVLVDAAGNAFAAHLPGVVYTGGRRVGGGINTDIRAEMTWQARASTRYATTAETMRFTRWDV